MSTPVQPVFVNGDMIIASDDRAETARPTHARGTERWASTWLSETGTARWSASPLETGPIAPSPGGTSHRKRPSLAGAGLTPYQALYAYTGRRRLRLR